MRKETKHPETISERAAASLAGSYGHGSCLPEDVLPAYRDALEAILSAARVAECDPERIREAEKALREAEGAEDSEFWTEACDALASAAGWLLPSPYYLGTHEGDGTDIGIFYGDPESPEDAAPPEEATVAVARTDGDRPVPLFLPPPPWYVRDPDQRADWLFRAARARVPDARSIIVPATAVGPAWRFDLAPIPIDDCNVIVTEKVAVCEGFEAPEPWNGTFLLRPWHGDAEDAS